MDKDMANYVLEDTRISTLQRKLTKEQYLNLSLNFFYFFIFTLTNSYKIFCLIVFIETRQEERSD